VADAVKAPLFGVATVLVNPDRGGIDHLHVAVIGPRASKMRSQTPILPQRRKRLAQVVGGP
jgi:hypothetical protein